MKRFITEYANAKKTNIKANTLIQADIKSAAMERIDKALDLNARCFITDDEAISIILNCFN